MNFDSLRKKKNRIIAGVMSGTSCDGIDVALVRISGAGLATEVELLDFNTFPYPNDVKDKLLKAHRLDVKDLCLLNFNIGALIGESVVEMKRRGEKKGITTDLIASHGHTAAHYPPSFGLSQKEMKGAAGTLQIGEPAVIAHITGLMVISDFRQRDIAAGGQGAPLVPYVDWLLFRDDETTTALLNIGGIANVTIAPPDFDRIMAFDTGPGNMIIDGAVRILSDGTSQIDTDGKAAARGKVIPELEASLLEHPYFAALPPKSAGREQFGPDVFLGVNPILS